MEHAPEPVIYTGTFHRNFDDKGRLTIPVEWRQGDCPRDLFISPSRNEPLLNVYPWEFIKKKCAALADLPSSHPNRIAYDQLMRVSQRVECDEQGRIMIAKELRERVSLQRNIVLAGGLNCFSVVKPDIHDARQEVPVGFESIGL